MTDSDQKLQLTIKTEPGSDENMTKAKKQYCLGSEFDEEYEDELNKNVLVKQEEVEFGDCVKECEEKKCNEVDCYVKEEPEVSYELNLPEVEEDIREKLNKISKKKGRAVSNPQGSAAVEKVVSNSIERGSTSKIKSPITKLNPDINKRPKRNRNSTVHPCHLCPKLLMSTKSLQAHQKVHNRPTLQCHRCDKVFMLRGFFERHNCNTICTICDLNLGSRKYLDIHNHKQHSKEFNILWMQCGLCGSMFSKKFRLALHMRMKHIGRSADIFICDFDGKEFHRKQQIGQHMTSHMQLIECQICDKRVKTRTIWSHMKTHETEYRFQCETCQRCFKSKDLLRHHVSIHEKLFKCRLCYRKFAIMHSLRQHMQVHDKHNTYQCEICGKTFSLQNSLKYHMKTHNKDRIKPYRCTRCDHSSYRSDRLKYHMKSHERIDAKFRDVKNVLKCSKCPALCKNRTLLSMHLKYVHPDVMYECDLCGRLVKTKANFKSHLRQFHKFKI